MQFVKTFLKRLSSSFPADINIMSNVFMIICSACKKGLKVNTKDTRANSSGIYAKFTDQKISQDILLLSFVSNRRKSLKY